MDHYAVKKRPFFYAVRGYKNTGKTTLIIKLIQILTAKGYQVAAIKHDGHDFVPDVPGTDSFRMREAGACGTAVFSKKRILMTKECNEIDEIQAARAFQDADILLLEGFMESSYPGYLCQYPEEIPDADAVAQSIIKALNTPELSGEGKSRGVEMTEEELMEGIALPREGRLFVRKHRMEASEYESYRRLFFERPQEFFAKLEQTEDKELLVLYLYIRFGTEIYRDFCKAHIAKAVYFGTLKDITVWYHSCMKRKKKPGLIQERWVRLSLTLQIFRLGRLQFEPGILAEQEQHGQLILPAGTKVLHIHIPEGEKLTPEQVKESIAWADVFFEPEYAVYDCDSWLLSTNLYDVLDEESNIIKFQKQFHIHEVTYPYRQAEERIFGLIAQDASSYPEHTSLQRRAKQYVLAGKDIGIGYGVIYR